MSRILSIDEFNGLVGYLDRCHVEKLTFALSNEKIGMCSNVVFWSTLIPLPIVIDRDEYYRGPWQIPYCCGKPPWCKGKLYLHISDIQYSFGHTIPSDAPLLLVRQTIDQLNAILAFDCTLSYKLRMLCAGRNEIKQ